MPVDEQKPADLYASWCRAVSCTRVVISVASVLRMRMSPDWQRCTVADLPFYDGSKLTAELADSKRLRMACSGAMNLMALMVASLARAGRNISNHKTNETSSL